MGPINHNGALERETGGQNLRRYDNAGRGRSDVRTGR